MEKTAKAPSDPILNFVQFCAMAPDANWYHVNHAVGLDGATAPQWRTRRAAISAGLVEDGTDSLVATDAGRLALVKAGRLLGCNPDHR